MTLRSRFILAMLVLLAAGPAAAQEPQPWTNTSAYGDRVVPALPSDPNSAIVVRADGGAGSTGSFRFTEDREGAFEQGEKGTASFLAGRSGVSYGWGDVEAFVTSHAHRVTMPGLAENPDIGPIVVNPYTQSGDAAIGARYLRPAGPIFGGVEGGVVLMGATAEPGKTDTFLAGPNTGATSFFVRGLATWQSGFSASGAPPKLTASVNLGYFADNSWKIWEQAVKDAERDETTLKKPLAEERTAMNFYGEKGPASRILFGASVAYEAASFVRPFFEITGESTAPDLTMRVTPGVAIRPMEDTPLRLFVSADLDLSGNELEASPRAPQLRANAGLQFAFGGRKPATGMNRSRVLPTPTPRPVKGVTRLSIRVEDEAKRPIGGAKVRVFEPSGGEAIAEGIADGGGIITLSLPARVKQLPYIQIRAAQEGYTEWTPAQHVMSAIEPPLVILYREKATVKVEFLDRGKEIAPPVGWTIVFHSVGTKRERKPPVTGASFELPTAENLKPWKVTIDIGTPYKPIVGILPKEFGSVIKVYLDSERKCIDFNPANCGAPAVVSTPGPAGPVEKYAIFEGESVDLKLDEAARLLTRLRGWQAPDGTITRTHKVIVQAKKGDPLFQNALAAARRDALLGYLEKNGVQARYVLVDIDFDAGSDHVLLEPK